MNIKARLVLLLAVAVIAAIVIVNWKGQDRADAYAELAARFGATFVDSGEQSYLACASDALVDLEELGKLMLRIGQPEILDLTGASRLRSFEGIQRFTRLRSLVAIDCPQLTSAAGLAGHATLQEVVCLDSASFGDATELRDLPSLLTLDLSGCQALEKLDLSSLPQLENLSLSRCLKLASIQLGQLPRLRQLYLDGCADLRALPGLDQLTRLTDLDISNLSSLDSIAGIGKLEELIVLDLRNVPISDFSEIGHLPKIRILRLGGQEGLRDLAPFAGLTSLKEIHLEACPDFRSLSGLPSSVSQYAGFTYCPELRSLAGLEVAQGLIQLDLTGNEHLSDLAALAKLSELAQLNLSQCTAVTDVAVVEGLEKLVIVMLGKSGVAPASVERLKPKNKDLIFDFSGE
jgi:internalin A